MKIQNRLVRTTCFAFFGACLAGGGLVQADMFDHCDIFGKKRRRARPVISPAQVADYGYYATRWRRSFHRSNVRVTPPVEPHKMTGTAVKPAPTARPRGYESEAVTTPVPVRTLPGATQSPISTEKSEPDAATDKPAKSDSLSARAARILRPRAPATPTPPPPADAIAAPVAASPIPTPVAPKPATIQVREATTTLLDPFPVPTRIARPTPEATDKPAADVTTETSGDPADSRDETSTETPAESATAQAETADGNTETGDDE